MRSIIAITAVLFLMVGRISAENKKPKPPNLSDIMLALIKVESSSNPNARRFEPHLVKRYKWPKSWGYSYGLTQVVYGFHYKRCGLKSPADLYDPKINIKCGARVLKDCQQKTDSLTAALGCYNGDKSGKYARKVMAHLDRISLSKR
jgi:soluble lytic murein transglycosylase-like protein